MAYRYNLRIEQGTTYELDIECGVPLVGCTAASQIRARHASPTPLVSFMVSINTTDNIVTLSLSPGQTSSLPSGSRAGVWDCELTDSGGNVRRLAEGLVSVSPEVTR